MHSIKIIAISAARNAGSAWFLAIGLVFVAPSACRDFSERSSQYPAAAGTIGTGGASAHGDGGSDAGTAEAPAAGTGGTTTGGSGGTASSSSIAAGGDLAPGGSVGLAGEPSGGTEDGSNGIQETVQPGCTPDDTGYHLVLVTLGRTPAAGVSRTNDGEFFDINAANQQGTEIGSYFGRADAGWKGWNCTGYAPRADRLIGSNTPGGFEQIFATTSDGKVYWRQQFTTGWGAFLPFNLPAYSSFVTDVAASTSSAGHSHVYILDRGRVFFRYGLTNESFAAYSEWIDLGKGAGGGVISSGRLPDGRQILFSLDALGKPYERTQLDPALGSAFGPWQPSQFAGALVDIECGQSSAGQLVLYAIQADGSIVVREANEQGVFSPWHAWTFQACPGTGRAIATVHQAIGNLSLLVVTTQSGQVYVSQATNDTWGGWFQAL